MRVLVTGATGLIGAAVVRAARAAGHGVDAMVRPASPGATAFGWDGVREVRIDLRRPDGLAEAVDAVDAVIHAAAVKSGDLSRQVATTVVGTERLLAAMARRPGRRLVALSSRSVYDVRAVPAGTVLGPDVPLDHDGPHRDDYARTKLFQDRLVAEAHDDGVAEAVTVRPGYVLGPGEDPWHPLLGIGLAGRLLVVGRARRAPLTLVDNVASAIVAALDADCVGQVVDVVDEGVPTNAEYVDLVVARTGRPRPRFVPFGLVAATAATAHGVATRLLGPGARLPSVLIPARVHALFKPLALDPARTSRQLDGWQAPVPFADGLAGLVDPR